MNREERLAKPLIETKDNGGKSFRGKVVDPIPPLSLPAKVPKREVTF